MVEKINKSSKYSYSSFAVELVFDIYVKTQETIIIRA